MIILNADKPESYNIDLLFTGALRLRYGSTVSLVSTPHVIVDKYTNVYECLIQYCLNTLPKKFTEFKFNIRDEFVVTFIPRYKNPDQTIQRNYPDLTLTVMPNLCKLELQDKSIIIQKGTPSVALRRCFYIYQSNQFGKGCDENNMNQTLLLT